MNDSFASEPVAVLAAFRQQWQAAPDKCALVQDQVSLSYEQLNALSDDFARQIQAAGLDVGQSVGLLCHRSIHVVAAMLGCLKSGFAFVPIDAAFPDERIHYMMSDSKVGLMLTDSNTHARAIELSTTFSMAVLRIDDTRPKGGSKAFIKLPPDDRRAYIMYTSGSTGRPKGVPISCAALACYCKADAQVYQLTADDRTLQFATLSFDISIEEIFPPLTTGGTVILRPAMRSDAAIEMSDIIERFNITAIHLATGYWHEWVDLMLINNSYVPESLRLMVVTGEKVSPEHYARWRQLCRHEHLWANAYGPTEATVSATVFIPPRNWSGTALPIGTALPGYCTYVLDDNLRPVAGNATGELYIGGEALAEGYLNQPEQTAHAFIRDPFSADPAARLYRTGDLARQLDNGDLEYAGRIDHQLKIGSYRIEPGEIENVLGSLTGVLDCLVCGASDGGRRYLVAYIAVMEGLDDAARTSSRLQDELSARLPAHMVPAHYVLLSQLPKTINGKVDRKALPEASEAILARRSDMAKARTPSEVQLCRIWQEVLGVAEVGIHDSFLSLGGDSLMAVRAIARIQQQMNFTVSTRDFFFLDTIELLAGHMAGKKVQRLVPPIQTLFINTRQRQLYCALQTPVAHRSNGRGILLVPSLGNEQRRCQRPFRSMMHKLAREGFHVLRFDWQGTGNSSGAVQDVSNLAAWEDDLQDAALHLSQSVNEIHVVSVRFGSLIAARCSLDNLPIAAAYHWDPVQDGRRWLADMGLLQQGILADTYRFLFRRKPRNDDMHEYAGLSITSVLYQQIQALNFKQSLKSNKIDYPVHILMADTANESSGHKHSTALHNSNGLVPDDIPGADDNVNSREVVLVDNGCEFNDWTNPRATTHDVKINRAARLTVELIAPSDSEFSHAHE